MRDDRRHHPALRRRPGFDSGDWPEHERRPFEDPDEDDGFAEHDRDDDLYETRREEARS